MAHQFNQPFQGQHTFINQFQHCNQRELNHRHTGNGLGRPTLLFFQQMRSMVGSDDGNMTVGESFTQGVAVTEVLDGRVHLNLCP